MYFGSNLFAWYSKKQHSRSSTKAKYRSLEHLAAKITWIQSLLSELKIAISRAPMIWCDNLSTVMLAANHVLHARTKHIKLVLYFVQEKVLKKLVEVCHVPSIGQTADVLTKLSLVLNS